GRVQTPTLAMLVAREQQIRNFVPRAYWEVRGDFKTSDGARFSAGWRHGADTRLATEALATQVVARDRAAGPAVVVERTRSRTVREAPPLLFDLTSLQRTANRRYHFSAQRTLEIAQALYERHKVLTYPRTDSRHLTTDNVAELPPLFASLASIPDYAPFAAPLVTNPPTPSRRVVDDTKVGDHHAIIPTAKPARLESLDRDEARIYDMVVRRFLGAFYPDAEFAVMEAWIKVGAPTPVVVIPWPDEAPRPASQGGPAEPREPNILQALPPPPDRYLARGRARMVAGWQDVAGIGADASADGASTPMLPPLVEGQQLAGTYAHTAKQTTPPPRYSEATLLGAMESAGKSIDDEALRAAMKDRGLGTPATRASIIETLLRRSYIVREKQNLTPTPMGIALIESLPVASLASPELTGSWEARLAQIARGEDSRAQFMGDIARYVAEMVDAIRVAPPPAAPPPGSSPPQQQSWGKNGKRGGRSGKRGSGSWSKRSSSSSSSNNGGSGSSRDGGGASKRGRSSWSNGAGSNGAASSNGGAASSNGGAGANGMASSPTRSASRKAPRRSPPSTSGAKLGAAVTIPVGTVVDLVCPCCRQGTLLAGARGWGCARWREGCRFVIWFETAGRRITSSQLRDLVTLGKTRKATFEPVRGAPQAGRLVLDVSAPPPSGAARFEPS
nr:hypothetical protein [Deltaproteobacteria bacterium]